MSLTMKNPSQARSFAAALIVLGSLAGGASAATIAYNSSGGARDDTAGYTLGYSFTTESDILVTELGVVDQDEDGLNESHAVGLWRVSDQALLGTTTVSAGTSSSLVSGFRFSDVSNITLTAGTQYVVAAFYQTFADTVIDNTRTAASGITMSSGTSFVLSASLEFPSDFQDRPRGNANFLFAAVPEPSSALLFGIGAAGLATRRRRN